MARRLVSAIDRWAVKIETVVASSLVVAIVAIVLVQVVMRYVFARPNPWTEELSRFAFIWLSLLGASLATKRGAHFLFESAVTRLSPRLRSVTAAAVAILVASMLVGSLVAGAELAFESRLQRSPALNLPMVWIYAALPVSAALMLLHIASGLTIAKEGDPAWASH